MKKLEQLCYHLIYFYMYCWDNTFVNCSRHYNLLCCTVVIKPRGFLYWFSPIEEIGARKLGGNISPNFMPSSSFGGSLVTTWCSSLVKLWLETNYNHSETAQSCWFKQPSSGNSALNVSFPPTSTDKSWNQRSKLPHVYKLLTSAKSRVRDHVKIITCNWMRSISFCSWSYRQVPFSSFSYGFIEFEAKSGD